MFFSLFRKKSGQPALDLQPGHEVELEHSDGKSKEVFVTEIVRADSKTMTLALPHGDFAMQKLKPGEQVVVHVETEEMAASFTATVSLTQDQSAFVIPQPSKVEWKEKSHLSAQRRNFVRFSTALPIVFTPIQGADRQGTTLDISGNGISMVSDFEMGVGKEMPVKLKLPDKDIKATGKIVRCQPYSKTAAAKGKYDIAMTFTRIEPKDQDQIVKYIFARQRDLRRRGLM